MTAAAFTSLAQLRPDRRLRAMLGLGFSFGLSFLIFTTNQAGRLAEAGGQWRQ